jgi:hypothetical protein
MHKNATKYNETIYKWCKNKHGASKIIDTFETYHSSSSTFWPAARVLCGGLWKPGETLGRVSTTTAMALAS